MGNEGGWRAGRRALFFSPVCGPVGPKPLLGLASRPSQAVCRLPDSPSGKELGHASMRAVRQCGTLQGRWCFLPPCIKHRQTRVLWVSALSTAQTHLTLASSGTPAGLTHHW